MNDNYYNKLINLLYILEQYNENDKISELKQFLVDIYYILQKGNCMAHSKEDNLTPLDLIFPLIEKESKQNYSKTKEIFLKLSFNEPLNYVLHNYYSLKDNKTLKEKINFSLKDLEEQLL